MVRTSVLLASLFLTGCGLPAPFQVASWIVDGISYLTTEKSLADHGMSLALQRDCALWRGVAGGAFCRDKTHGIVLAAGGGPDGDVPGGNQDDAAMLDAFVTSAGSGAPSGRDAGDLGGGDMDGFLAFTGGADSQILYAAREDVNVRSAPRKEAIVVVVILKGGPVVRLGEMDGWMLVRVRNREGGEAFEGWIDGGYLARPDLEVPAG